MGEGRNDTRPSAAAAGRSRGRIAILALLAGAVAPTGAWADHPDPASGQLQTFEREILGPEHAAEHAAQRRAAKREVDAAAAPVPRASRPSSEVGAWTAAPFALPNYAIHAALLPTGKVLFWGYPPIPAGGGNRPNRGEAALWDPGHGTGPSAFTSATPPAIDEDGDGVADPAPIYCSGQSFLPNGDLLATGGNFAWDYEDPDDPYTEATGLRAALTFDPWSEKWTIQPQMEHGRWYPSQVLLADGRSLILSGYEETAPGAILNPQLEVFHPSAENGGVGTVARAPSGDRDVTLYPHLFTMPGGDVLLAGPEPGDSAILDTDTLTWRDLAPPLSTRNNGNAVLRPMGPDGSTRVTQIAGISWQSQLPDGTFPGSATTETIDLSDPDPQWEADAPLSVDRAHSNAVLLPDGSTVVVGGGHGFSAAEGNYPTHDDGRARQVEILEQGGSDWILGPPQEEDRTYHSTALLLPDGRVMSAGDDFHPAGPGGTPSRSDTAEIYSPPYLYRGDRPQLRSSPPTLRWGDEFGVRTSTDIARLVLMAPSAVTHAVDMSQRHVELEVSEHVDGVGVDAVAPPDPTVAPPGYYMMFALNSDGVPSVARWVRLDAAAPDQPTLHRPDQSTSADLTAPTVTVRARRKPPKSSFSRSGRVVLSFETDERARVVVNVGLLARNGETIAIRKGEIAVPAGEEQTLAFGFPRRIRHGAAAKPQLDVDVAALDGSGNKAVSSHRLRAGRR